MNVLFIIAPENFRDEEYKIPKAILEKNNITVTTASVTTDIATGMLGYNVKPEIKYREAVSKNFDAVLLVGGNGAKLLWDEPILHSLLKSFYKEGKLIGAICLAPVILAKAGLLKGRRATVYETATKELKAGEALYTGNRTEADGNIITGNGPGAARELGNLFLNRLMKGK